MKLTSDYCHVTALFNTPPEGEIEYGEYPGNILKANFEVGHFTYAISFTPTDDRGEGVYVKFRLIDINVSDEELVEMMSKLKMGFFNKDGIRKQKQSMSLKEAEDLKHKVLKDYAVSELEIMGSSAIKVFGTVLSIIKDYIRKYRTKCVIVSAASEDRFRLYQRMVKSAFPRARIEILPGSEGDWKKMEVCLV